MPFAAGLRRSLETRNRHAPAELTRGDSLEHVLDRHLLAVEENFDGELVTSILLLSPEGMRVFHGAGPNLPREYREAIDGSLIGPRAGSCGTAAYFGRPVYVSDIATDPLWADYRHLALPHGLRSCWSTPIRDLDGAVIGTFATYHRTAGSPTQDEIEAIDLIAEHVSNAILWARGVQDLDHPQVRPVLRLVNDESGASGGKPKQFDKLLDYLRRLEELATELERQADGAETEDRRGLIRAAAEESRKLAESVRRQLGMTD